jgi:hypothetical protein
MPFTQAAEYWEEQKCNYLLGAMDDAPSGLEVHLYVGSPGDDGNGGNDVTTTIRPAGAIAVTFDIPMLNGSNYEISNTAAIDFGNSAADVTGAVDYAAIYDTGGSNLICYGQLAIPLNINASDPVSIGADEIKIRMQDTWGATAQQALLNWLRGTTPSFPSGLYVALYTSAPNYNNTGTEVTTSIRIVGRPEPATGWNGPGIDGTTQRIDNEGKIDFGASANTLASPITHVGVFDAASAGNLLIWGELAEDLAINAGSNVFFEDTQLGLRAT